MTVPTFNQIHQTFEASMTGRGYINIDEINSNFVISKTKVTPPYQIFTKIIEYVNLNLVETSKSLADIKAQIEDLKILKKDGEQFYKKYHSKFKIIKIILKVMLVCIPTFIKAYFPKFFANNPVEAERKTLEAYTNYQRRLEFHLSQLAETQSNLVPSNPSQLAKVDEYKDEIAASPPPSLAPPVNLQEPKPIDRANSLSTTIISRIQSNIQALNKSLEAPLSLKDYKKNLLQLDQNIQSLIELCPRISLNTVLKDMGLDEELVSMFEKQVLTKAILTNQDEQLFILLQTTPWKRGFEEPEIKNFAVSNTVGVIGPRQFKQFNGIIALEIVHLEELLKFLTLMRECQPKALEIKFRVPNLTTEYAKQILAVSQSITDLILWNLEEIDLTKLDLTAEEELMFLKVLLYMDCPHLKKIIIPDRVQHTWSAEQYASFISIYPFPNLIHHYHTLGHSSNNVSTLPPLFYQKEIELSGYTLQQMTYLLSKYFGVKKLKIASADLTNEQINEWKSLGLLQGVTSLDLEQCPQLTTDIIDTLAPLPTLWQVKFPTLHLGQIPIERLPKMDNPFKIRQYYLQSPHTKPYARSLYDGPCIWASVFQIPLAREKITPIFSAQDKVLDSKSLACWLYKNDYTHISPQNEVEVLLADYNDLINDDNLIELVQKFPQLKHLSLYCCPRITNAGLNALFKILPQTDLETLDIRGNLLMQIESKERLNKSQKPITLITGYVKPQLGQEQQVEKIDVNSQLKACMTYSQDSSDPSKQMQSFIHDRIALQLFGEDCNSPLLLQEVNSLAFDPLSEDYRDFSIDFKKYADAQSYEIKFHRDILYSQLALCREGFRPGGNMVGQDKADIINQNASPEAILGIVDLIYGKDNEELYNWVTLAEMAELTKLQNLGLANSYYKELRNQLYIQFDNYFIYGDRSEAGKIQQRFFQLEDHEGYEYCERKYEEASYHLALQTQFRNL